jgi:hypothetical protein
VPYGFRRRLDKYSGYIRTISEQLDLDNKYSQALKNNFLKSMFGMLILLLTIFGWRELASILMANEANGMLMTTLYIASLIVIAASMFFTLFKMKSIIKSFSDIFCNAMNHRNVVQSRNIVRRAFMAFGVLTVALLFPFIMFMFNLKTIYILFSFIMLVIFAWEMYRLSHDSEDVHTESYTRISLGSHPSINHGWKI